MELKIQNGDYVLSDSHGTLVHLEGAEALLQRVLLRLTAHRGAFPFLDSFGSNLWMLGKVPPAKRQAAAEQDVAEALAAEEDLHVENVSLQEGEDGTQRLSVQMDYSGEDLTVSLAVR